MKLTKARIEHICEITGKRIQPNENYKCVYVYHDLGYRYDRYPTSDRHCFSIDADDEQIKTFLIRYYGRRIDFRIRRINNELRGFLTSEVIQLKPEFKAGWFL